MVDNQKVEKIGKIICDCLDSNNGQPNLERINDCSSAMAEGLSVIKSDSLRYLYLRKSDTYLQKNCYSYIEILSTKTPNSDIRLETRNIFFELKKSNNSVDLIKTMQKKFLYRNFVGDTIYLQMDENALIQRKKGYDTTTTFSVKPNESKQKMFFLDSDEAFFKDYYAKNEPIDFLLVKEEEGYRLFTSFLNGIILSKRLWKVD